MFEMIETGNYNKVRTFENEKYISKREFFENGIIDYGYDKIKFDFSNCKLENTLSPPKNLIIHLLEYNNEMEFTEELFEEYQEEIFEE